MLGQKFGKWEVVSEADRKKYYLCMCQCGKKSAIRRDSLILGGSTQCKECRNKERTHDTVDFIGKKIGKWLVLSAAGLTKTNTRLLNCQCECGITKELRITKLVSRETLSCRSCSKITHAMSKTSTYYVWREMISRCTNKKNKNWKWYGARGITVCDRWFKFENFLQDMGIKPNGLCIDRIHNDGSYSKFNCKWSTIKENANNTSLTKIDYSMYGKTFAKWSVIREVPMLNKSGKYFECQCMCGNIANVSAHNLRSGLSKQCKTCRTIQSNVKRKRHASNPTLSIIPTISDGTDKD